MSGATPPITPAPKTPRHIVTDDEQEDDHVIVEEQSASGSVKAEINAHDASLRSKLIELDVMQEALSAHSFVITAEKVQDICKLTGLEKEQLLQQLVSIAQTFAHPRISEYKVGVAGLGKSGKIYLGANLEFPRSTLKESVHAEQSLVVLMRNEGETGIEAIALSAPPCGYCRQFLREIGDEGLSMKFLTPGNPILTLAELLPYSFGPKNLSKSGELLIHPEPFRSKHEDSLTARAIEAAHDSYCPYTKAKSGIAIQTSSGKVYQGSYLENAAHNPSVSPLQSALIALVADGHKYYSILRVVLVEKTGDVVTHASSTQTILSSIAHLAKFHSLTFEDI